MKHLKLLLDKAQEAYKSANADQKKLLIDLYGKEHFLIDIRERVIDYESACREIGIEPLTVEDFDFLPEEDQSRAFNRHQVVIGARALCGDWKPNFKDTNQAKWYAYFYGESEGFSSVSFCDFYYSVSGSDLMLPTQELTDHIRKSFKDQFITYLYK